MRARFLWGWCDRLITPRALGPLHDIAHQAGGALAQRARSNAAQHELFGAFIDELTRPRQVPRPVVVVEDVHWADEATLDLLVFLGRRIQQMPALMLVTFRDDEIGPDHRHRGALAALPRDVVSWLTLAPLTRDCVLEQAAKVGLSGARIFGLTGGNPLLVTEMLRADVDAVPRAAQDLILDRLRSLPDSARELAIRSTNAAISGSIGGRPGRFG
ncbi:hypothetical protein GCM10007977_104080 [Dactylosporangium sucinum]|uniref:Orc1-like AAA ATPase domain-containing protein n=2 Tax=Dactylosporangium sucinum TaxID=1424081 RepID=A0A917X7C8_9ACTN|nr:hypothetical protein GCM10007977_104080 [Dactylosporangium sucinum]